MVREAPEGTKMPGGREPPENTYTQRGLGKKVYVFSEAHLIISTCAYDCE